MESMKISRLSRLSMVIISMLLFSVSAAVGAPLQISQVSHDPVVLDQSSEGKVLILYQLSADAVTEIDFYDSRDQLIRTISSDKYQHAGNHQARWDGRDETGKLVPPNYYTYVIRAEGKDGEDIVYDLTDLTGGQPLTVPHTSYDSGQNQIEYILPAPALVNIRIGLPNGGPLLGTLVDWVARPGGHNSESWDGWDTGKVINISEMKNYQIGVSAYALPNNSIIVMGEERLNRPVFIENSDSNDTIRQREKRRRKQMYNHWQHPRDKCYDPVIQLSMPQSSDKQIDGLPVIDKPKVITMDIREKDQAFTYDQRFEVVYYLDFVFVYEEELGYAPFNWRWDPHGVNEGVHYITAMLRGYEGHFGTTTLKVFVKNPSTPQPLVEK